MYGAPTGGHRVVVNLLNSHPVRSARWSLPAVWRADFLATGYGTVQGITSRNTVVHRSHMTEQAQATSIPYCP